MRCVGVTSSIGPNTLPPNTHTTLEERKSTANLKLRIGQLPQPKTAQMLDGKFAVQYVY